MPERHPNSPTELGSYLMDFRPVSQHSMMYNSDTDSRSSYSKEGNSHSPPFSTNSSKYKGRRYTGKLPISDIPELVDLCSEMLQSQNITGLAMIARQVGLPPHLRCQIWPILLKYHPFVQNPYVEISENDDDDNDDIDDKTGEYKIPYKEIKFDLKKYLRSAERYKPQVMTPDAKDMFEIQEKIFDVIELAIIKFLKKWGSIVNYNSALTWIALGLAEWLPPLPKSQFVLCGLDDVAKNGTKLRNINETYFERLNSNSNVVSETSSTFQDSSFSPTPNSATPLASPANTPPSGSKQLSFAELYERMALVILYTPDPTTVENKESSLKLSLSKDLKQLSLLPYTGGPITDRISFFLFAMRKLLPELHSYLAEEDSLSGDWMLWWLKYDGSKVWSRYDRGRTWDLLLGYRTDCKRFESNMKELFEMTNEQVRLLGQDIFWNPMDNVVDDTEINDSNNLNNSNKGKIRSQSTTTIVDMDCESDIKGDFKKVDKANPMLSQISKNRSHSISLEKTPTLASLSMNSPKTPLSSLDDKIDNLPRLDEIEQIHDLPFSKIHPHVEIIFISLAFLKSKEFTITELDQSEIKTLFHKLSSLKSEFDELGSFVSTRDDETSQKNGNSVNNNHVNKVDHTGHINGENQGMMLHHRKSNRDIENILIEAGELWRRFLYITMIEETNLD